MNTMRSLCVGLAFASAFAVPLFAGALTIGQIQQQIAALLAQVTLLQQQIAQLPADRSATTVTAPPATTTSSNIVCPVFNSTLSRGGRGGAVTALQKFLIDWSFLTPDSMTGFYGSLTESAVRNFQSQQGIVSSGDAAATGWGAVGKLTSAAIVRVCSSQVSNPAPGTTNPNACATVPVPSTSCNGTWTANLDSRSCVASWQCVSSSAICTMQALLCPAGQHVAVNGCSQSCVNDTTPHVCPVYQRMACPAGQHYQSGPTTYNSAGCEVLNATCVSDVTSSTLSASPTSGAAPLAVTFTPSDTGQNDTIDFGDGQSVPMTGGCIGNSNVSCMISMVHTYISAGSYTAKLLSCVNSSLTNGSQCPLPIGSVTITVGGSTVIVGGMCPSITRMDCPTGQHYQFGATTYNSMGCPVQDAQCVPDTSGSCGVNGMYANGQAYFLKCPANSACAADPGWFVCRSGAMVRECTGLACYQQ